MTEYRITYEIEVTQPEKCEKGGWKVIKAENAIPSIIKVDAGVVIQNRQYPIK